MAHKTARVLISFAIIVIILAVGLISWQPYISPLNWFVRGAALLGYLAVSLSILSSAHAKRLYRTFGRPFIRVHHVLSVSGLILVTLHPLGAAVDWGDPRILLPKFDAWSSFLRWGGPPAWTLIVAASLAALLRRAAGRNWRVVHGLNYAAFLLATAHALMLGTDFAGTDVQHVALKAVVVALAAAVALTFVQRRFQRHRQKRTSARDRSP